MASWASRPFLRPFSGFFETADQTVQVTAAAETETAVAVSLPGVVLVTPAAEVETAVDVGASAGDEGLLQSWGMIPIGV